MIRDVPINPNLLSVPVYVAGKPIEQVQREFGLDRVIKLASNENPLGPSPRALAALREALCDGHRYPGMADLELRRKLAAHYNKRYSASLTEKNFLTGNGISDLLRMISHAFLFNGGEALYCDPTFPLYSVFPKLFGATPVAVGHDNFHYNLRALSDAVTPQTRVIFICNPNNPTGTIVSHNEIDRFMARLAGPSVVVFDESYFDFVEDREYTNSIDYVRDGWAAVIVLRGFSKSYGLANLRIGYAIMNSSMAEYLSRAQIPFNTGDPVLRAAAAALDDEEYLQASREHIAREREFLYRGFARLNLSFVHSQANFILLHNLPEAVPVIADRLLRRGVILRPMDGFGMPDAIRASIGTHDENERLLQILAEVLHE